MHQRVQEVLDYLDQRRGDLRAAVDAIPGSLDTRRAWPDRWSAAEVVEHLGLVEARISRLIAGKLAEARATGLGPERDTSPVLPTLDLSRVLDRGQALVASDSAQPRGEMGMAAAWSVLERSRAALRDALIAADGLALGEVSAPHPFLGPLNLYHWLIFVGAHEARHTAQVREVAAALAS